MGKEISAKKWLLVYSKTNSRCAYCGKQLPKDSIDATIDHVIPKTKGGRNNIENLLPCCRSCNTSKGVKTLEEYRFWYTCKKYNIPRFSTEQLLYLSEKIKLKKIFPKLVKFYFETL